MTNKLLRTADVASILSVAPETVRNLNRAGELPAVTIAGDRLRYRVEDVAAYLKRNERKGAVTSGHATEQP